MANDTFEFFRTAFQDKKCHGNTEEVRRAGYSNFRVAADDDGVRMMARVAPAPGSGFAHNHEGSNLVNDIIHPCGAKRGAVTAFVPARVGRRAVEQAVRNKTRHTPPRAPEMITEKAG